MEVEVSFGFPFLLSQLVTFLVILGLFSCVGFWRWVYMETKKNNFDFLNFDSLLTYTNDERNPVLGVQDDDIEIELRSGIQQATEEHKSDADADPDAEPVDLYSEEN